MRTLEEKKFKKYLKDKRYRKKYSDILRVKKAEYYQKNKTRINKKINDELKTNVQKRLAHTLRRRVSGFFRGAIKAGSAVQDLGCSIEELKTYLELKFYGGMTWENYGDWHVDHIIPLCRFDLTKREEFLKACHFSNLQPLWAFENLSKGKY